ncbi:MAG: pilus assembly protein [Chloroflexi bacterium]|nr:MAG: pilus assembly protein [Chloroflexota bacterium]
MRRSHPRGQAMIEMALLAPMIFMLLIFVFDLARAAATWAAISEAVREGSRNSVVVGTGTAATDNSIVGNAQLFGVNLALNSATGCIHGHTSGTGGQPNAPQGQAGVAETVTVGCNAVNAAGMGTYPLKVVIAYNFQPFTPFAQQFMPGGITMVASSTMNTEF